MHGVNHARYQYSNVGGPSRHVCIRDDIARVGRVDSMMPGRYTHTMRRKLLLVNPVNAARSGLTINPSSRFQPLGLGIIAALTPDTWDVEIADENFERFEYRPADLVGFSAFTASVNRAYEIAALYRAKAIPTVLGGIHASMLPQEAGRYVNTVVVGEAEGVWKRLIRDFEQGRLGALYRGEQTDLTDMPRPRRDLFHPGYLFGSIQTSRGCPMNCEFCSVTAFNGSRFRQRPIRAVLDELETIPQNMIFFVDDNLVGYGRDSRQRAVALCKGMIERGIRKSWFCQASMNFADDDELLYYAGQSGCRMVFLGIEAENTAALGEVNKKLNLNMRKDYERTFQRINRHGIAVLGAFIYGMDSDTAFALKQRTAYILNCGVDVMQTTFLTPLPGTRLFRRIAEQKRLLHTDFPNDWHRYDMTEVVHTPLRMKPEILAEAMHRTVMKLYSRISLMRKFFKTWRTTKSLETAIWAYSSNRNYRNVAYQSGR
jgi:radical SAM superfamily enzyme YgiQ (UPF0313 family)